MAAANLTQTYGPLPKNFRELSQWFNYIFREYRENGEDPNRWDDVRKREAHETYTAIHIPHPDSPRYFDVEDWEYEDYEPETKGPKIDRNTPIDPATHLFERKAQDSYKNLTSWFGGPPRYVLQRPLGYGGNGLAVHYKFHGIAPPGAPPGRDIVVKVGITGTQNDNIRVEEANMRKVKKAAHCVQIIEPEEIGKPPLREFVKKLPHDDSSEDYSSSGSDSVNNKKKKRKRPKKPSRKTQSAYRKKNKSATGGGKLIGTDRLWDERRKRREERDKEIAKKIAVEKKKGPRRDYLVMEYLENGDLATLIYKLQADKAKEKTGGRIPNRVLWSFWLCLIRACVAMHWPPRKIHDHRKEPRIPEGAIPDATARRNKMLKELKGLGIKFYNADAHNTAMHIYRRNAEDLIEKIPSRSASSTREKRRRARQQNMIHFDIDPQNIFIGGFELGPKPLRRWEAVRKAAAAKKAGVTAPIDYDSVQSDDTSTDDSAAMVRADKIKDHTRFRYTRRRPDRAHREHELVPRLKLGDFGMAQCVKPQKRNVYYLGRRLRAKFGFFAPEQSGPEWDRIPPHRHGGDLARSMVAGFFGPHTNIFCMAQTMWILITQLEAPAPPAPQAPYHLVSQIPTVNGKKDIDTYLKTHPDTTGEGHKISYCPLFMDPQNHDYDWVDKELRETIFKCMYHEPRHRPLLDDLLPAAIAGTKKNFPGETDDFIRQWVHYWLFEAPSAPTPPGTPRSSNSDGDGGGGGGGGGGDDDDSGGGGTGGDLDGNKKGEESDGDYLKTQQEIQYNHAFPHGYDLIPNNGAELQCGMFAVADSLRAQLGPSLTVNGNAMNLNLPSKEDLRRIFEAMRDVGEFDAYLTDEDWGQEEQGLDGNYYSSVLAAVLQRWGEGNGLELQLCYIIEGRDPLCEPTNFQNPLQIWIHNDNLQELSGGVVTYNHYEGMRPKSPPPPPHPDDSGDVVDLPDYRSSEE
ncbi:hypothetical protein F5X99DRAFT_391237 [Biscogniauxia marginata]|nr:hypothetical protein F5X99DRAFT_391237 [Biscogniauxia marginata]